MTLHIHTLIVSDFQQNARVLIDDETHEAMVIDPGGGINDIFDCVDVKTNTLKTILLTHCHIDHGGGVQGLLDRCEKEGLSRPQLLFHSKDNLLAKAISLSCRMYGLNPEDYQDVPEADTYVDDMGSISFGSRQFKILFTPGHAPGHVAFYLGTGDMVLQGDYAESVNEDPVLIAGDTLFQGSIGRTDLPMGDHATLLESIREKLFTLPDNTIVLPGHGPNTRIGHEKQYNPFLN